MSPDTPIPNLPLAVLDVETTGLDPETSHVVDVAVVHGRFGDTAVSTAFSSLVRPPIPIPPDSTRIHGITDADVASSPTWAEVADRVAAACEGRLVVAYNAPADFGWTREEMKRIDRPAFEWPWLDLLVIRKVAKPRGAPGKLGAIATEHGIVLDAHGATGDALATALLVRPLMRRACEMSGFRPRTLGELLTWQRGRALEQEQEYAAYCKRRGDAKPPSCLWHLVEGLTPPSWAPPKHPKPCPQCGARTLTHIDRAGGLTLLDEQDGQLHQCPGQRVA